MFYALKFCFYITFLILRERERERERGDFFSLQRKNFSTKIMIIGGRIYTTIQQVGKGYIPNLPKRKREDKKGKRVNTQKIKLTKIEIIRRGSERG